MKKPALLAAAVATLLLSGAASASSLFIYVIVLKDGTRIEAKEKPAQKGKLFIYQTPLGASQSIPSSEIDQQKTEEVNKEGLGGAYTLDAGKPAPPTPRPTKSIGAVAGSSKGGELGVKATPAAAPTPIPTPKPKKT